MQQIYKRTPISIFRTPFPNITSRGMFLEALDFYVTSDSV